MKFEATCDGEIYSFPAEVRTHYFVLGVEKVGEYGS